MALACAAPCASRVTTRRCCFSPRAGTPWIAGRAWSPAAMILKVLVEHAGEIVSREDLLERVWGYDVFPSTRTVDNFILRLRKRFEKDPANPRHFLTVWGRSEE